MNSFIYDIPTKVYFGENQLGHLGEELGKYGEKVLLTFAPSLGHISAGNRRKLGARNPAKAYDFVSFAPSLGRISAGNRHELGEKAKSMI